MVRLLLDSRWTKRDRLRYAAAVECGDFPTCSRIIQKHMTPEQIARARQRAKAFRALMCDAEVPE